MQARTPATSPFSRGLKMPALLTQRDREIHRLRLQVEEHERWLQVDAGDRRAVGWHRAKLAELRDELAKLED
jgi:hypothetical protein